MMCGISLECGVTRVVQMSVTKPNPKWGFLQPKLLSFFVIWSGDPLSLAASGSGWWWGYLRILYQPMIRTRGCCSDVCLFAVLLDFSDKGYLIAACSREGKREEERERLSWIQLSETLTPVYYSTGCSKKVMKYFQQIFMKFSIPQDFSIERFLKRTSCMTMLSSSLCVPTFAFVLLISGRWALVCSSGFIIPWISRNSWMRLNFW